MIGKVDFSGVISFVARRRKATGGYGATPRLPATIEDTFEALALSQDLAILAPGAVLPQPPETDPELRDYLRDAVQRNWPGLRTTGQLIRSCCFLGIPVDPARVRDFTAEHRIGTNDLRTTYYTAQIDSTIPVLAAAHPPKTATAIPDHPTVRDVRMHLSLQRLAGDSRPTNRAGLLAWLQRCQNGDGGFGFFPGTTSFIENSHHCLAALTMLGAAPRQPELARQFVMSCQTGGGGFGRSLRAAPFLDSTWHALACLRLLP